MKKHDALEAELDAYHSTVSGLRAQADGVISALSKGIAPAKPDQAFFGSAPLPSMEVLTTVIF